MSKIDLGGGNMFTAHVTDLNTIVFDCRDEFSVLFWGSITVEQCIVSVDIQYMKEYPLKFKEFVSTYVSKLGEKFLNSLLKLSDLDILCNAATVIQSK